MCRHNCTAKVYIKPITPAILKPFSQKNYHSLNLLNTTLNLDLKPYQSDLTPAP